jgi:hypothetical protein
MSVDGKVQRNQDTINEATKLCSIIRSTFDLKASTLFTKRGKVKAYSGGAVHAREDPVILPELLIVLWNDCPIPLMCCRSSYWRSW